MAELQCASASIQDEAALQALWQRCFGDSPADTARYFHLYGVKNAFVGRMDGTTAAMCLYFPASLRCNGGKQVPAAYLYCVCTAPLFRGRGLCSHLLEYCEAQLRQRGYRATILVPANMPLFAFYEKRGYHTAFYAEHCRVPARAEALRVEPVSAARYCAMQSNPVQFDEQALRYQKALCRASGGDLFALTLGEKTLYATVLCRNGALLLRDCTDPACLRFAAALASRLSYPEAQLITSGTAPYGMLKWLADGHALSSAYLGLAFD